MLALSHFEVKPHHPIQDFTLHVVKSLVGKRISRETSGETPDGRELRLCNESMCQAHKRLHAARSIYFAPHVPRKEWCATKRNDLSRQCETCFHLHCVAPDKSGNGNHEYDCKEKVGGLTAAKEELCDEWFPLYEDMVQML